MANAEVQVAITDRRKHKRVAAGFAGYEAPVESIVGLVGEHEPGLGIGSCILSHRKPT